MTVVVNASFSADNWSIGINFISSSKKKELIISLTGFIQCQSEHHATWTGIGECYTNIGYAEKEIWFGKHFAKVGKGAKSKCPQIYNFNKYHIYNMIKGQIYEIERILGRDKSKLVP